MTAMGFPASPSDGDKYEKWVFQASSSSWVIDEASLSLSASTTDDLAEGSTNFYYTNDRFDDDLDSALSAGKITVPSSLQTSDSLGEGSTNLYFTDARADARVSAAILDEDNMASDDATKAPSQQSVKAYVDASTSGLTTSNIDPAALVTEAEGIAGTDDDTHIPTTAAVKDYADAAASALLLDEDNMASDDATKAASQQSTKAYVDNEIAGISGLTLASLDPAAVIISTETWVSDDVSLASTAALDARITARQLTNTDSLSEGSTNFYYTNSRFDSDLDSALSAGKIKSVDSNKIVAIVDSYVDSSFVSIHQKFMHIQTTTPSVPLRSGEMWLDPNADKVRVWDGDVWFDFPTATDSLSASFSDIRLKDNVQTITSALDKVDQLRGVEFDWNSGPNQGRHAIGVIAQEVEEVLPELINIQSAFGISDLRTVEYDKMMAVMIEAIKELKQEQKRLNTVIEELLENK